MLQKFTVCVLVFCTISAGCTPEAPQAEAYPDKECGLDWSSEKLALARAYSERIGSAAVMIVDDGVVVDAWGDLEYKYSSNSIPSKNSLTLSDMSADQSKSDKKPYPNWRFP